MMHGEGSVMHEERSMMRGGGSMIYGAGIYARYSVAFSCLLKHA